MDDSLELRPAAPAFSLAYLFAWVGACAIFFALSWPTLGVPRLPWISTFFVTAQAMNFAAGLVGLALYGLWWWQGREIAWQPGHWLLCVVGALGICYIATRLVMLGLWSVQADWSIGSHAIQVFVSTFSSTGRLTALIAALACVRLDWPWRVVPLLTLVHIAAMAASGYATNFFDIRLWDPYLMWVYSAAWCGALLALIGLAVRDAVKTNPRDWMHWAGMAAWGMLYVPELVAGGLLWLTL